MTLDDPDLASIEDHPAAAGTIWDRVSAVLEQRRTEQSTRVSYVLTRWPDWQVTYRLPSTAAEIGLLAKSTATKRKKDPAATNRLLLARCCVGLSFAGEELLEDDGTPMTWASTRVRQILGAQSSTEALTIAYRGGIPDGPGDGEITAHADDLVDQAGFGDGEDQVWRAEVDPTPGQ